MRGLRRKLSRQGWWLGLGFNYEQLVIRGLQDLHGCNFSSFVTNAVDRSLSVIGDHNHFVR